MVGDVGSSRDMRRGSDAAVSRKIPARVEAVDATSAGFVTTVVVLVGVTVGFTFGASSSVSDSSSELVSSSELDSSFLATGAADCDDWRKRL